MHRAVQASLLPLHLHLDQDLLQSFRALAAAAVDPHTKAALKLLAALQVWLGCASRSVPSGQASRSCGCAQDKHRPICGYAGSARFSHAGWIRLFVERTVNIPPVVMFMAGVSASNTASISPHTHVHDSHSRP